MQVTFPITRKRLSAVLGRIIRSAMLPLGCLALLPQGNAQEYHRHADMLAAGIGVSEKNSHAGLLTADDSLWSYWLLPQGTPLQAQSSWLPLPNRKSLEFRERLTATAPDHYFILHDYRIEPGAWHLYWNRKDGQHSPHEGAALIAVFTAPEAGSYVINSQLSWQHWPGAELRDGTIQIWQKDGRKENLLATAQLASPQAEKVFKPVAFDNAIDGRTLRLKKGEQIILKVQSSRSSYRGITIDDSQFSLRRQGASELSAAEREATLLVRQLETLLYNDVAELAPMRKAIAEGNPSAALDLFRDAFIKLNAQMLPPLTPYQWLFDPTTAEDLRKHSIHTIVYGEAQRFRFDIGAPGEVIWDQIGIGKYPYLLRDLSTMHWANALAGSAATTGPATDAQLWIGYWADLATRWPQLHDQMLRNKELRSLLIRDSLTWARKAPLYFGWRLNNFFSWLPNVARNLDASDYGLINAQDLARTLIWFATDEIPLAVTSLEVRTGVPNQRRLLANGLLESAASLQWFKHTPGSVAAVNDFIGQMAKVEMLPDGGSMEQSLNYNKHMPEEVDSLLITNSNLPPALQFSKEEVGYLKRARSYRFAMLNSLLDPKMHPPSIGKNNPYVFFSTWPTKLAEYPVSRAIDEAFKGNTNLLDFTSVYFPWSGYAALRTDWTEQAAYSIFQNSRAGLGHHRESALHLSIFAYGSPLLVTSGAEQYSMTKSFDAYFQSSISQNTISVDGYSQLAQRSGKAADYNEPIQARWLSSEQDDYVEGYYSGPYGGWNYLTDGTATARDVVREVTPKIFDVSHERRVIFLRQMRIWIVLDRVHSEQQHQFTQSWNFSPLFTPQNLHIDEENQLILAALPDGPALTLLQASTVQSGVSYKSYYGVHAADTILGWVSKDSAPKAYDFAAAPDVHRLWQSSGTQSIITVLAAIPDGAASILSHHVEHEDGMLRLSIQLAAGNSLQVAVNNAADTLVAEAASADATVRIDVSPEAATVTINTKGALPLTLPMQYPAGFNWRESDGKWQPDYSEPNTLGWEQ